MCPVVGVHSNMQRKELKNKPLVEAIEYHRKQEQIKAIDDITGLLKDFTPEQMKIFKEAVKRRPLF